MTKNIGLPTNIASKLNLLNKCSTWNKVIHISNVDNFYLFIKYKSLIFVLSFKTGVVPLVLALRRAYYKMYGGIRSSLSIPFGNVCLKDKLPLIPSAI